MDEIAQLRNGPYLNLPFAPDLETLRGESRALSGMLERLGRVARDQLVVAIPFFEPLVLDAWLDLWTSENQELRILVIHRQEPHHATDLQRMRLVFEKWTRTGKVAFRTFPARDLATGRFPRDAPTFHCKMIDPGTGQIILLTSNLTSPAKTRNVEAAYVFSEDQGEDFRHLLRHLQRLSAPDPIGRADS